MSRAAAAVRFADGTVKWALYNGTTDRLVPLLFDDPEAPWDAYYGRIEVDPYPEPEGEIEDVTVFSDYGDGWTWPAKAARNLVVAGRDPFEDDGHGNDRWPNADGRPAWFDEALKRHREET